MSERLTVQYSILASEMDVEIKRLLTNSLTRLSKLDQSFGEDLPYALGHVNDGETNKLLTAINNIRNELAEIDYSLNECASIAYGYHEYLIKKQAPPPAPSPPEVMAPPKTEADSE